METVGVDPPVGKLVLSTLMGGVNAVVGMGVRDLTDDPKTVGAISPSDGVRMLVAGKGLGTAELSVTDTEGMS